MAATTDKYKNIWGLYDDALKPIFDVDTCVDIGVSDRSKVSKFPIEKGTFSDYNKVQEPISVKLHLAVGGDKTRIDAFIAALKKEKNSVHLYKVIMPEVTYESMTLSGYDFKRAPEAGVNLVSADLTLEEIRQVALKITTVALPASNVKAKSSASSEPQGTKQTNSDPKIASGPVDSKNAIARAYADTGHVTPTWLPDYLKGNTVHTNGGLSRF